jgi:hypothetical protein
MRAGSIIADIQISGGGATVLKGQLEAQVGDKSSALYRGKVTKHAMAEGATGEEGEETEGSGEAEAQKLAVGLLHRKKLSLSTTPQGPIVDDTTSEEGLQALPALCASVGQLLSESGKPMPQPEAAADDDETMAAADAVAAAAAELAATAAVAVAAAEAAEVEAATFPKENEATPEPEIAAAADQDSASSAEQAQQALGLQLLQVRRIICGRDL